MSFFIPSWWFLFLLEYHLEKNFPNEQYVRPAQMKFVLLDGICHLIGLYKPNVLGLFYYFNL
ncbi:hypothetical protein C6X96_00835 [Bacillus pumilus]|nr:hypothetical protein C6X96_00835 [Bacillus pumilus]